MSGRTPSSLKWLIHKQARLAGEIERKRQRIERCRTEISHYKSEIADLLRRQRQVEAVMLLHAVRIDPRKLRPIRPHHRKAALGYGGLTRVIYKTLGAASNNTATTRQIMVAVLALLPSEPTAEQREQMKQQLRIRLCIMAQQGMIRKLDRSGPCDPCSWHLANLR